MERCKYCVAEGETLLSKMQVFAPDMNWLRLWAVNGADDGLRQREKARARTHACIHSSLSTADASLFLWQSRSSFQFRLGWDSVYLSLFLCGSVNLRRANHRTISVLYDFESSLNSCTFPRFLAGDDRTLTLDDPDLLASIGAHRVINVGMLYKPRAGETIQVRPHRKSEPWISRSQLFKYIL